MPRTRRTHRNPPRNPKTRRPSSRKPKTHRRRTQRGGYGIYTQAWRAFIEHGTITDFTQAQLKNFNLYGIDNPNHYDPKHPDRNLNGFIYDVLKEAPADPNDPNSYRNVALPPGAYINGITMYLLADRCFYINRLTIHNCPSLKDDDLWKFYDTRLSGDIVEDPDDAGNVDHIDFKGCTGLTPESAEFFQAYDPLYLNLSDIPTLTDEWLINSLPEHNTPVTLHLNNNPLLTNAAVFAIAQRAPNFLQRLEIRNNPNITYAAVEAITQAANHLTHLDFRGCPKIQQTLDANPLPPNAPRPNIQNPFPPNSPIRPFPPGTPLWHLPAPPPNRHRRRV